MKKDLLKSNEISIKSISENPLKNIDLSNDIADKLLLETIGETAVSAVPIFREIIGFLGNYEKKLNDARLTLLLNEFRKKHENTERFQESLKNLFASPSGINLLQKILRILNAGIIDFRYVELLSTVLKNISDTDFIEMFEEHNYVLSQIEKLTPQAVLLLRDNRDWPGISFSSSTTSGVTSGEGWDTTFATLYSNRKNMPNEKMRTRITHSVNELKNNHLIELRPTNLPLTAIGEEVFKYLS